MGKAEVRLVHPAASETLFYSGVRSWFSISRTICWHKHPQYSVCVYVCMCDRLI